MSINLFHQEDQSNWDWIDFRVARYSCDLRSAFLLCVCCCLMRLEVETHIIEACRAQRFFCLPCQLQTWCSAWVVPPFFWHPVDEASIRNITYSHWVWHPLGNAISWWVWGCCLNFKKWVEKSWEHREPRIRSQRTSTIQTRLEESPGRRVQLQADHLPRWPQQLQSFPMASGCVWANPCDGEQLVGRALDVCKLSCQQM